jgi:PAS domain S-box-containing protein
MEERLLPEDSDFKTIAGNSPDPILIVTGDNGQIVYCNSPIESLSGFSASELISRKFMDFLHPQEQKKLLRNYQQRLEGKPVSERYESRVVTRDGRIITVEIKAKKISWNNRPADFIILQDLSDRKWLESYINTHKEALEGLGENVTVTDRKGNVVYTSKRFYEETGIRKDGILGHNLTEFFLPEHRERFPTILDSVANGKPWQGEVTVLWPEGKTMVGWVHMSPLFSNEGKFMGSLGVSVNISERASLVEQFKAQNEILNTLGDSFILTDLEGRTLYVSDTTVKKGGWNRETTTGVDLKDFIMPEFHPKIVEMLEMVKKGKSWFGDAPARHGDGRYYHGLTHASPLRDSRGQIVGVKAITVGVKPYEGPIVLSDASGQVPELESHLEAIKAQLDKIGKAILQTRSLIESPEEFSGQSSSRLAAGAPSKLAPVATKHLEIYCLGPLNICSSNKKIQLWQSLRAKAIFEYLITKRRTPVSRDVLMEAIWPDYPEKAAANNLKTSIHDLRQTLAGLFDAANYSFIVYSQGGYLINPDVELMVDAEEFERLWTHGKRLEKNAGISEAIGDFEKAEALYQGDYLEDELYEEWTMPRREALKDIYLLLVNKLAEHSMTMSDYESCITYCHRILAKDACREDTYRRLMSCYSRLGQKNNALRWYDNCRQTIKSELNSPLAPETIALYNRLVKGETI